MSVRTNSVDGMILPADDWQENEEVALCLQGNRKCSFLPGCACHYFVLTYLLSFAFKLNMMMIDTACQTDEGDVFVWCVSVYSWVVRSLRCRWTAVVR